MCQAFVKLKKIRKVVAADNKIKFLGEIDLDDLIVKEGCEVTAAFIVSLGYERSIIDRVINRFIGRQLRST